MKKNRMMRLASGLLVAVLATTSMISGTYAKYTTQDSANDVARVAKWGVELQVVGNLYGDTYTNGIVKEKLDTGENIRVNAADTSDVVAPGTLNADGFVFKANGTPEVDYQATVVMKHQNIFLKEGEYGVMVKVANNTIVTAENFDEFEGLYTYNSSTQTYDEATVFAADTDYYTLEDYVDLTDDYYPVVYALTGSGVAGEETTYNAGTVTADSLANVVGAIGSSVSTVASSTTAASDTNNMLTTVTYVSEVKDTNTKVEETLKLSNEKLTWAWAFCSDTAVCSTEQVGDDAQMLCKADTILGNLMAGATETQVVMLDGGSYIDLNKGITANENDYLVFKGATETDAVACLQTSFDIDITVTQVD